jgi:hypothetical protein
VDLTYYKQLKQRVVLAIEIDKLENQKSKVGERWEEGGGRREEGGGRRE